MKRLFIFAAFIFAATCSHSQTIKIDSKGNYVAVKDTARKGAGTTDAKPTGKTFTDTKGNVYPVLVSKNGKLFVVRTSKTGNKYNYYLKVN